MTDPVAHPLHTRWGRAVPGGTCACAGCPPLVSKTGCPRWIPPQRSAVPDGFLVRSRGARHAGLGGIPKEIGFHKGTADE